jgi:FkbM family methyltransferase
MPLSQFHNSIQNIFKNNHINRREGIYKHLQWQWRKALNRFPYEQKISQSRIIARDRRCGVSALINAQGLYDFNNMNLLKLLLQDGGIFFDIGANIGSYTLIASEQPKAEVYSFEPHPSTFQMLKQNVEINARSNTRLYNIAFGNSTGEVHFTDLAGSSINHFVEEKSDHTISVECQRADLFCDEKGIVPILVKIDVEGFEYEVLNGFGACLVEVDLFLIEMNGLSDSRSAGKEAILDIMKENQFSGPYSFDFDTRLFSQVFNGEDCIFVSESFLKRSPVRFQS